MTSITTRGPNFIILENGQQIPYSMSQWPESSPGQPYRKSEVLWDGSKVVLKTQAQLDSDAASKALPATDAKMPRALEDLIDVLITKNTFKKNEMPAAVQELYDLKKELRSKILP